MFIKGALLRPLQSYHVSITWPWPVNSELFVSATFFSPYSGCSLTLEAWIRISREREKTDKCANSAWAGIPGVQQRDPATRGELKIHCDALFQRGCLLRNVVDHLLWWCSGAGRWCSGAAPHTQVKLNGRPSVEFIGTARAVVWGGGVHEVFFIYCLGS